MTNNGLRTFASHVEPVGGQTTAVQTHPPGTLAGAPGVDLRAMDAEAAARHYLTRTLASDRVPDFVAHRVGGQNAEFKILGTTMSSLTGTRVVMFRQHYRKIPVYGSLVTVELGPTNEFVAINSALGEPNDVDPIATLSPAQAMQVVRRVAGASDGALEAVPRLHYYFDEPAGRWRLAYVVENVAETTARATPVDPHATDYVIDAHSGEVVAELARTHSRNQRTRDSLDQMRTIVCAETENDRLRLHDEARNITTYDFGFRDLIPATDRLPGTDVVTPPSPWLVDAVSAHANAAEAVDFLSGVLKRDGWDDHGMSYVLSVRCLRSPRFLSSEWRNAMWTGAQVVFGQTLVDGRLRSLAAAKDIVAHEIFHGVTHHTARLEYRGMSGALNESYSDIFGAIVNNFGVADFSKWDWKLGEEMTDTGMPVRDMSQPARYAQPEHMTEYKDVRPPWTEYNDFGGVHVNSGIHNKAAYNILTSRDEKGGWLFDAASVAKLFYLALTLHLSRTSTFLDSRRAVELVAVTLFRWDRSRDLKLGAIADGFNSVGIVPDARTAARAAA